MSAIPVLDEVINCQRIDAETINKYIQKKVKAELRADIDSTNGAKFDGNINEVPETSQASPTPDQKRLTLGEVKLLQFATAHTEALKPQSVLKNAELKIFVYSDLSVFFNPTFISGSGSNKFLATWTPPDKLCQPITRQVLGMTSSAMSSSSHPESQDDRNVYSEPRFVVRSSSRVAFSQLVGNLPWRRILPIILVLFAAVALFCANGQFKQFSMSLDMPGNMDIFLVMDQAQVCTDERKQVLLRARAVEAAQAPMEISSFD